MIATDGVTLRGKSGHRERVVLDGAGTLGEGITIRACSGVTIADLTVRNIRWNGIKFDSETGVQRATVRNCILQNIWQRAIKGVKVPLADREKLRPRDCRIEYCLFANDRPKRFEDDPADTPNNFKGNYIGGIDVMFVAGWSIRDNVFVGIRGRTGEARGAVFLWHDARDCVIERNIIVDCDSGICLGNSHKPDDVAVHCTGIIVAIRRRAARRQNASLISSAVARVQTRVTRWPAISSLVASREPYEAPRIRTLRFMRLSLAWACCSRGWEHYACLVLANFTAEISHC